ncbi:peptidylprolyl isomerase [Prosthecobacter sp.]|uniref:peptidylprolyl isomerase n=1 Tax=Prosthecobacter sp. TaxID=1965333 RepID=UPI003784AE88
MNPLRHSLILLIAATFCSSAPAQQTSFGIAAVVDGVPIMSSEVAQNIREREQMLMFQYQNDPAKLKKELALVREGALENLIDREILLAEFRKMGGVIMPRYIDEQINTIIRDVFKGNRDALVDELAKVGTSMKKYREEQEKMFIMQVMRQRHSGEHPPATPREVQEYYDKNVDKWREGDQIKISTITILKFAPESGSTPEKQKKIAEELRTKILQGADFAALAKTFSRDSHSENGGAWEWMYKTDLMPAIADAAMSLKTGGISPVLDMETSYVIVSCDAKKLGAAPSLEQYRAEIERMINAEKSKANIDRWMESVRKKHVIKRFQATTTKTPAAQ